MSDELATTPPRVCERCAAVDDGDMGSPIVRRRTSVQNAPRLCGTCYRTKRDEAAGG